MIPNDRYEELKREAQERLAAKAAANQREQEAWTVQAAVKRHKFITAIVAVGLILVAVIAFAGHGSNSPSSPSQSPYAQGMAWEASQEAAGAVLNVGVDVATTWCQSNQPADMTGDWADGCVQGYINHHPGS